MNFARMVNCLDHDLCDQIIATAWEYNPSKVLKVGGAEVDPIRTNTGAQLVGGLEKLAHEQINKAIVTWAKRISQSIPPEIVHTIYLGVGDFDTWREVISVLKYEQGEEYKWHVDQCIEAAKASDCDANTRFLSVICLLE